MDAHVMIRGFVQGIGYRKWTKKEAQKVALTGWVRNLPDGSVEALLQGDKDILELFIEKLKQGPFMADVKSVDTVWEEQKEVFEDFTIRHDF